VAKKEEKVSAEEPAEQPKKKSKLIIILAVVILALAGAGGGAWWYFSESTGEKLAEGDKQGQESEDDEGHPPVYERLETFTVNLSGGDDRYLQVDISLKVADRELAEKIKQQAPEIRDNLLRLLTSKTAEELSSVEGKNKLGEDIQGQINGILRVRKEEGVQAVLFTSFIIQ
jgi:flagellar protein FliL